MYHVPCTMYHVPCTMYHTDFVKRLAATRATSKERNYVCYVMLCECNVNFSMTQ